MPVLDELLVRIGMDSSGVDQGVEETTNRLDGLAAPAAAAGLAAGAVFAAGIAAAMDIAEAQHQLQNSLNLTEAEAERAGGIAGDVFSSGFGESLSDVSTGLASVTSAMGKLGDFTDAELEDMTKKSLAFAKTFEIDVADASTAAGQLINQGLVKDGTEAFDVLTRAAQTLPKSMVADLPAIVTEYGQHFKRIGLDASTSFGLMSQFVKAGGRDIDQAADVLHEFARITSEETDRAKEGFKALGLNGTKMLADIGKGGKPAADALQLTLDKLRGVEDPAKRAQLGVALFGDMAGEAADALLAMNPETAKAASGMDTAAGASKKLTDSMQASPAQQMDAALRTLQMTLGEALLPVVKEVSHFITEHKDTIKELIPIVLIVITTLGLMAAAIWIVNIAMMANPIGLIVAAIIALIAIVVILVMKWDWVKAQLLAYWEMIKDNVEYVWGAISDFFSDVWEDIEGFFREGIQYVKDLWARWDVMGMLRRAWGGTTRFFSDLWQKVVDTVNTSIARIKGFFGGMWDGVVSGLKFALNGAIWMLNQGIGAINVLIGGANRIPGVNISYIPYMPYLAEGGITTGPTVAMIGEGREQEAVLPLSKLEQMINMPGAMPAPSVAKVQPGPAPLVLELRGGSRAFREFFQESVKNTTGGDIIKYVEG
ncbi:phage tail tape measure protein [Streptomyces sp. NPDC057426]|uniref:phage tail tape measure protein n=1 Tax=Streptomyces sp. NPDC057426 TaxID=3346128 RepID=UPI0036C21CAE